MHISGPIWVKAQEIKENVNSDLTNRIQNEPEKNTYKLIGIEFRPRPYEVTCPGILYFVSVFEDLWDSS